MKLFIVLAVVLGASAHIHHEFHKFKAEFGKTYLNHAEESYRKKIFADNVKLINEHNAKYDNGEVSYFMGINHLSDLLPEELPNCFTPTNMTDVEYHEYDPNEILAGEVDWRQRGAVTPVKNQGNCGSCWAFSTTGSLEGAWAVKTGQLISLSEQNLVDCSHNHCSGCRGGLPWTAMEYIQQNGIDSEEQYPYTGYDGQCRQQQPSNSVRVQSVRQIQQGDEQGLQSAVASIGPVSIVINSQNDAFHHYRGGVLDNPGCPTTPDHAILAIGYGTDPQTGQEYWLVKNSWSSRWGMQGYAKIAKNKNMCGIATASSYPVV